MKTTTRLRQLLDQQRCILAPGISDGLSAKLVEQAGFEAIYASGGAIARSCGFPDIGLLSFTEVLQQLQFITSVTTRPVIADADTGFGNAINVARTLREFERLGVAACHLEDQLTPKRCGHLDNKELISRQEMQQKIRVAKSVLCDPDFSLIARTDAIAVEGFDAALDRAQAYLDAGADVIFVEAPQNRDQIEQIAKTITAPKLINMFYGGKTPLIPIAELQTMGYQIVIIPSDCQRAAIKAIQQTLAVIKQHGDSQSIADQLATFQEREKIIETEKYLALAKEE